MKIHVRGSNCLDPVRLSSPLAALVALSFNATPALVCRTRSCLLRLFLRTAPLPAALARPFPHILPVLAT